MLLDQLDELCAALAAAGVPATYDPLKLNPPCAWVAGRQIVGETLDGTRLFEFDIYLIVPESDIKVALTRLEGLLDKALSVPGIAGRVLSNDLGEAVVLPSGGSAPAFKLTITTPTTS